MGLALLCDRLSALLTGAQRAGAVRLDVTLADIEAPLSGCIARDGDPAAVIAVVNDGLKVR